MDAEFTVHIHLAYPKVSNWFALLPTKFDSGAEVKVTLLGSAASESFTVSEDSSAVGPGENGQLLGNIGWKHG